MFNPQRKVQIRGLSALAATLPSVPAFNFSTFALAYPQAQTTATYGLSEAQYRHLFIPGVSNIDGVCGPDQAETATFSSAKTVADNMNKFVAWINTQF